MSYEINYTDTEINPTPITVSDQTLNTTDSSLVFVGKNYPGYGKFIGENFLHLLENFASKTEPTNPTKGQLWYYDGSDFDPAEPQLRVYDGTRWVPASGIKKGPSAPAVQSSITGDMWIDTANQQLYLFAGSKWVLVGPSFSSGTLSGLIVEQIIDRSTGTEKSVLSFYANDNRVATLSADDFQPKVTLAGFPRIRQGLTLSTVDFDGNGVMLNKYWGTAEKADALVVGNATVTANNFLRGDTVSTTNFTLNVRNGGGIVVGQNLSTSLTTDGQNTALTNKSAGGNISLRLVNSANVARDVLTVIAVGTDFFTGVNNPSPTVPLDIIGNVKTTGLITTTNTSAATSATDASASIHTNGSASIAGKAWIGAGLDVIGTTSSQSIVPKTSSSFNLGAPSAPWDRVYANTVGKTDNTTDFVGNFSGTFEGDLDGTATGLATTSVFRIIGDVSSNAVAFNGTQSVGNSTIATVFRNTVTSTATIVTTAPHNLVTGYLVSITCGIASFNATNIFITKIDSVTFTYTSVGVSVPTTSTTGTVVVSSQAVFNTAISYQFIADKEQVEFNSQSDVLDSDRFLIYRATDTDNDNQPSLLSVTKETLLSNIGTVPVGSIFPFAGTTPPAGYLLCDGSEQNIGIYSSLFNAIGYSYSVGVLRGFNTFALPDMRGRHPIGLDNMNNGNTVSLEIRATGAVRTTQIGTSSITTTFVITDASTINGPFQVGKPVTGTGLTGTVVISAVDAATPAAGQTTLTISCNPQTITAASGLTLTSYGVTDGLLPSEDPAGVVPAATTVGNIGGSETKTLTVSNLPDHKHTLKDTNNNQYYAFRYATGTPSDPSVTVSYSHNTTNSIHLLPNSGSLNASPLGQPFNIMNPYLGVNYIIFTGRIL